MLSTFLIAGAVALILTAMLLWNASINTPASSTPHNSPGGSSPDEDIASQDESVLGLVIGSDGASPHVELGAGIGIDLSDGSPTIDLGGGLKLDTDGDGIKFKF